MRKSWITQFSSVSSVSHVWLFATPWTAACQASLSITNSWSLLKLMSTVCDAIQPSHPLLSPFPSRLQSFPASGYFQMSQLFTSGGQSIGVSASTSVLPGPISFRMDWLDLLQVQGTLDSLLQHHSSKASILWRSAFIVIQQSHPYMTTGKTIALTRWTFVHSWALNSVTGAVIKERRDSNTNTEAEATWRWKQRLDSYQQRKRLRIFISFRASGGRTTLVTPTLR